MLLAKLMKITIQGPEQSSVNFEEVFKEKIQTLTTVKTTDCIQLLFLFLSLSYVSSAKLYCDFPRGGGRGDKLWSGGETLFNEGKSQGLKELYFFHTIPECSGIRNIPGSRHYSPIESITMTTSSSVQHKK